MSYAREEIPQHVRPEYDVLFNTKYLQYTQHQEQFEAVFLKDFADCAIRMVNIRSNICGTKGSEVLSYSMAISDRHELGISASGVGLSHSLRQ